MVKGDYLTTAHKETEKKKKRQLLKQETYTPHHSIPQWLIEFPAHWVQNLLWSSSTSQHSCPVTINSKNHVDHPIHISGL